jgi:hypothetical protein
VFNMFFYFRYIRNGLSCIPSFLSRNVSDRPKMPHMGPVFRRCVRGGMGWGSEFNLSEKKAHSVHVASPLHHVLHYVSCRDSEHGRCSSRVNVVAASNYPWIGEV